MTPSHEENLYQERWKKIARLERQTSVHPTSQKTPKEPQTEITPSQETEEAEIIVGRILDLKYLLYDKKPICLYNGVLYAMYPIDDPSLGYKLVMANFNKDIIMLRPHFINEQQALALLFSS